MTSIEQHLDRAIGIAEGDDDGEGEAILELVEAIKKLLKKLTPISHCSECGMLVFKPKGGEE